MTLDVSRQDPRYNALKHGFNLRWPSTDAQAAGRIALCEKTDDVAPALQHIIDTGMRPTARSGGHCYEDFVCNNPDGAIVDLSLLNAPEVRADGAVRIPAGTQNWNGYLELYKRHNLTLPGGSCYSVGAGGHICGGGYGLLSRLQGLTVDWLSAVDIVTVDRQGRAAHGRCDARSGTLPRLPRRGRRQLRHHHRLHLRQAARGATRSRPRHRGLRLGRHDTRALRQAAAPLRRILGDARQEPRHVGHVLPAQADAQIRRADRDAHAVLQPGRHLPRPLRPQRFPGPLPGLRAGAAQGPAYPFWPQLYYGNGDLYAFLQRVKRRYDPNNIFHHAMSVRP
ncbi:MULTISPECIES: FAD-binding protein [Ralstonia solanacearum species complex]|uniref:FAD-binding protein n=1 Tax=Ralstonia solanacearum species complex TaxID=3116862 RepID=UPI0002501A8C|nr:hypothetical protein RSK60_120011 [Ralstonia solanacearum K60]